MKVMDIEDRSELEYCSCIWCGQWITKDAYLKRIERKRDDPNVCKDCSDVRKSNGLQKYKSKRTDHPELGVIFCYI
jgi:NAD-dependent SIR2 family protein deacetylase